MGNFIFSINATMPVFLVMVVGYLLRKTGMLNDEFVNVANKFNFKVTLPCLLIQDLSSAGFSKGVNVSFVLFCAAATAFCFVIIWPLTRLFLKDKSMRGAFVQASFRSSAAVMGIAFVTNIYGSSSLAPFMILGAVPLYNIFSVIVLTFEADGGNGKIDGQKIKKALIGIITNPIIIGIIIGMVISMLNITFPVIISKTISSIGALASPLSLIVLGASFDGSKAIKKFKPVIMASLIKLVLQAAIILPFAIQMGFRNEELVAIIIMLAAPTTPSCFIMAKSMGNDGDLTASIVVVTTLMASVTLTAWIFILKSMGLIC